MLKNVAHKLSRRKTALALNAEIAAAPAGRPKAAVAKAAAATHKPMIEMLEARQLMAADYDLGINLNTPKSVSETAPILKDLKSNSVRLWMSISDWNTRKVHGTLKLAQDYKQAGFHVMVIINNPNVPSYSEAKGYYDFLASQPEILKAVDRWEIGNEVDHANYWKGTLKQYVQQDLKAAWDALHGKGEEIVSAGPSWNPDDVAEMKDYGLLNYTDYVGFHPYVNGYNTLVDRTERLKKIVGNKPILATEWSARGQTNSDKWAALNSQFYPYIRDNYAGNYYFAFMYQNSTAGPGAVVDTGLKKRSPFYDMFKSWDSSSGSSNNSSSSSDPTKSTTSHTPTSGSTPSSAGSVGSVTKISLYDANTNQPVAGYTDLATDESIDLSKLPGNRKINFVAAVDGTVESVKFGFDGDTYVETLKPYAVFGDQDGRVNPFAVDPGTHKLTVQAFSKNFANGTSGSTETFNLKFVGGVTSSSTGSSSSTSKPTITSLKLVDSKGKTLADLYSGKTIKLSSLPTRNVSILATGSDGTESVKFTFNNKTVVETLEPYAFFGDNGSNNIDTWYATSGTYTLSATGYSKDFASGTSGSTIKFNFKLV